MRGQRIETLAALGLLLLAGSAPAAAPLNPLATLDVLLAEYRLLGLPLPPRDARLVRCRAKHRYVRANGQEVPARDTLAFLVRDGKRTWLLRGTERRPVPE